jgi:hypothetical protein
MHPRAVVLVTSLAVVPISWPAAASPQLRSSPTVPDRAAATPGRAPAPAWDTFTADVTIRRHVVKSDGTTTREAPAMRYRWRRTRGETGWKTTLSLLSASGQTVHGIAGPRVVPAAAPVSRIEIGDARTPMRVFDAAGQLMFQLPTRPAPAADGGQPPTGIAAVTVPSASAEALAGAEVDARSTDWVEQFLPSASDRVARRARLMGRLGSRAGSARGLERFVSHDGGDTTEVLMDPSWAVPVEVNVSRKGRLMSHSVIAYQQAPGAGLVRRRVRSEQLLSPESGDRAVAEIDFENIRLGVGGVR